jgi:TrmH family RNA methyltransferase
VLFGNEGAGVSDDLLKLCEKDTIIIPQSDGVESLNVAAAAAVCLFEQRRQRL